MSNATIKMIHAWPRNKSSLDSDAGWKSTPKTVEKLVMLN